MTGPEPIELAERALGFADGEAQATVVRERSLLSRFAVSSPTQATEVDDLTVSVLRVHDGHTGSADTNATTDAALRDVAARAGAAARASAVAAGAPGDYPGLPAPAPARPHDGFNSLTAQLEPAALTALEGDAQGVAGGSRVELRGQRVEAVVRARGRRRGQAGVVAGFAGGVRRRPRGGAGTGGDVAQRLVGRRVGLGRAGVALVDAQQRDREVVDLRGLCGA